MGADVEEDDFLFGEAQDQDEAVFIGQADGMFSLVPVSLPPSPEIACPPLRPRLSLVSEMPTSAKLQGYCKWLWGHSGFIEPWR